MKIHPTLVVLNDILLPKVRVTLTFSVMKMNVFYFSLSCGVFIKKILKNHFFYFKENTSFSERLTFIFENHI